MYSLSVEQKVGVAMKEVCSSSRYIRGTGVLRQGYKVHLLACHVITQADKVEIRRNKDQCLLHQLSTTLWKHLHDVVIREVTLVLSRNTKVWSIHHTCSFHLCEMFV